MQSGNTMWLKFNKRALRIKAELGYMHVSLRTSICCCYSFLPIGQESLTC